MGQLVLLVVAAAWAAVLIPPLLRSRIENRPNSSVSDFRRQLNRLQSSVPARAGGSMRPVGRPLAPSPLYRQAAPGRPGVRTAPRPATVRSSHHRGGYGSSASDHSAGMRRHSEVALRRMSPAAERRRRRTNVLFSLVLLSASTLFLAATTKATVMLYLFAIVFLALCGYMYLLAQIRQRNQPGSHFSW
jgi:hypothetical protein